MFTIRDIVDIAIKVEVNGEKTYREASRQVKDSSLAAMLGWLADQEREHARWFKELGDQTPQTLDPDSPLARMGREMLQNVVGDKCFTLDEVDLTELSSVSQLVEASIELEYDTFLFYEMLAGFITDQPSRKHLRAIMLEEQRHVEVLREFAESGRASAPPA